MTNNFAVGQRVKRKFSTSAYFPEGIITSISQCGQFLRIDGGHLRDGHGGYYAHLYELDLTGARTAEPLPLAIPVEIDWTKPIQFRGYIGTKRRDRAEPAKFIGMDDKYHVVNWQGGYTRFTSDGKTVTDGAVYIENVPPPPVWPVKKWFVTWCNHQGRPNISGQKSSHDEAETFYKNIVKLGNKSVVIQEVSFNGPA